MRNLRIRLADAVLRRAEDEDMMAGSCSSASSVARAGPPIISRGSLRWLGSWPVSPSVPWGHVGARRERRIESPREVVRIPPPRT